MVEMFHNYLSDVPYQDDTDFNSYIREKKEDWGFDSLCFVDKDAMYYDNENSFSLLSQKEIIVNLLTERIPVILDNVLFEDENKLVFLSPVENLSISGKTFKAMERHTTVRIYSISLIYRHLTEKRSCILLIRTGSCSFGLLRTVPYPVIISSTVWQKRNLKEVLHSCFGRIYTQTIRS